MSPETTAGLTNSPRDQGSFRIHQAQQGGFNFKRFKMAPLYCPTHARATADSVANWGWLHISTKSKFECLHVRLGVCIAPRYVPFVLRSTQASMESVKNDGSLIMLALLTQPPRGKSLPRVSSPRVYHVPVWLISFQDWKNPCFLALPDEACKVFRDISIHVHFCILKIALVVLIILHGLQPSARSV